jgi:hypothetical protein
MGAGNDGLVPLHRHRPCHAYPVSLYLADANACQPRHFARMWCKYSIVHQSPPHHPLTPPSSQNIQTVGIDHAGYLRPALTQQQRFNQSRCRRTLPQSAYQQGLYPPDPLQAAASQPSRTRFGQR